MIKNKSSKTSKNNDTYNQNTSTGINCVLDIVIRKIIRFSVSILAILMTVMIFCGVIDVAKEIYNSFASSSVHFPGIQELIASFGAFMAVLIAIEILINITVYLQDNFIHTKIVMATALIAVARKVIVLEIDKIAPHYVWALAAVILATSIGYWLTMNSPEENERRTRFYSNRFHRNKNYKNNDKNDKNDK